MGAFVISKKFNGDFKFVFTSRKGKVIFTSLGYAEKSECEAAVEKVKANVEGGTYVKFKASGGKYFFRLVIGDLVMATSRKYTTQLRLQKGIDEIIQYGSVSEVLDFSENDFVFFD